MVELQEWVCGWFFNILLVIAVQEYKSKYSSKI